MILAITVPAVVAVGGRLEVAVLQLLHIASRDRPVGETADIQRQHLLGNSTACRRHRFGVGSAVGQAAGAFDLDAVLAPSAFELVFGTGGDGHVALAILDVEACDEAAAVGLADLREGGGCCLCCCLHG
ncbi:hypothetical protein D9M70_590690 [compost metagenome]